MSAKKGKIPTTAYMFDGVRVRVCRLEDKIYIPMVDVLRAIGHAPNARRVLMRLDPKFNTKLKIDHHTPTNLIEFNGLIDFLRRSRRFNVKGSRESLFYLWAMDLAKGNKLSTPVARAIPIASSSDDAAVERLLNDPKSLQKIIQGLLSREIETAPIAAAPAAVEVAEKIAPPKKTINLDAIRRYAEQQGGLGIKDCAGVIGVKWARVRSYAIEAGWATVGSKGSTLQPTSKAIEKQFMRIRQNRRMVEKNEFVYDQPVIMPEGVIAMINHFDKN